MSPETKAAETEWKLPPLKLGQRVYVGRHPDQLRSGDRVIGVITKIYTDTVDISTFHPKSDRIKGWEAARHIDDPTLANLAQLIREDYFAVFVDAEADFQQDAVVDGVFAEVRRLTQDLDVALKRLDLLENKFASQLKRGPGRPRKVVPETEEVNV